jgi:hypothetical protein
LIDEMSDLPGFSAPRIDQTPVKVRYIARTPVKQAGAAVWGLLVGGMA